MTLKKIDSLTEVVILRNLKKHHQGNNNLLLYRLAKSWEGIIGKNLAIKTQVFTIQDCTADQKNLIIKVLNPADLFEINSYRLMIQARVNLFFGQELILQTFLTS